MKKEIIFSFSSEIKCNRRQINNYKYQVTKSDILEPN